MPTLPCAPRMAAYTDESGPALIGPNAGFSPVRRTGDKARESLDDNGGHGLRGRACCDDGPSIICVFDKN